MITVMSAAHLSTLISELLVLENQSAREALLSSRAATFSLSEQNELVALLQEEQRAIRYTNYDLAIELGELIQFYGELVGRVEFWATGRLQIVDAQVAAQGDIENALVAYDSIIEIYQKVDNRLAEATAQIIRIWVLFLFGRSEDALERGEWAASVFGEYQA